MAADAEHARTVPMWALDRSSVAGHKCVLNCTTRSISALGHSPSCRGSIYILVRRQSRKPRLEAREVGHSDWCKPNMPALLLHLQHYVQYVLLHQTPCRLVLHSELFWGCRHNHFWAVGLNSSSLHIAGEHIICIMVEMVFRPPIDGVGWGGWGGLVLCICKNIQYCQASCDQES